MRTFLTTLLTAALTALVGAPVLQPYTILAGDDVPKLEEKAAPTILTVGEIKFSVENINEGKPGLSPEFVVLATNQGDKKGKATAKALVSSTPRTERFSRMMPMPTTLADIQIEANLAPGETKRFPLAAKAAPKSSGLANAAPRPSGRQQAAGGGSGNLRLALGATLSVTLGEGDRWVQAAVFTVPQPPAAEPVK